MSGTDLISKSGLSINFDTSLLSAGEVIVCNFIKAAAKSKPAPKIFTAEKPWLLDFKSFRDQNSVMRLNAAKPTKTRDNPGPSATALALLAQSNFHALNFRASG